MLNPTARIATSMISGRCTFELFRFRRHTSPNSFLNAASAIRARPWVTKPSKNENALDVAKAAVAIRLTSLWSKDRNGVVPATSRSVNITPIPITSAGALMMGARKATS